jgi:hypothetical protein
LNQAFNNIYQIGVFAVYVAAAMLMSISSGSFMPKIYRDSIILFLLAFVTISCYFVLGIFLTFAYHIKSASNLLVWLYGNGFFRERVEQILIGALLNEYNN